MVEYILCYGGPAEHWGPLPATSLASRKILIEQNIKKRTGPALWLLYGWEYTPPYPSTGISNLLQPALAEGVLGQLSMYLASWVYTGLLARIH
jgi:hypothetical protein